MLGISFDPGAHLDFDFISTKEPISTHPRSSHDIRHGLERFYPPPIICGHCIARKDFLKWRQLSVPVYYSVEPDYTRIVWKVLIVSYTHNHSIE